jgi:hypothetical protein
MTNEIIWAMTMWQQCRPQRVTLSTTQRYSLATSTRRHTQQHQLKFTNINHSQARQHGTCPPPHNIIPPPKRQQQWRMTWRDQLHQQQGLGICFFYHFLYFNVLTIVSTRLHLDMLSRPLYHHLHLNATTTWQPRQVTTTLHRDLHYAMMW